MMRIGFGYDLHRLEDGDGLMLGGIFIPSSKRAIGHSDADALIHAIIDSLLGAASLGDIGEHFPPDNPELENISSRILLQRTMALVKEDGWAVQNIDSTIILQRPKLADHKILMAKCIAEDLGIPVAHVAVKAKTKELVDAAGEERAVEAYAVTLLSMEDLPSKRIPEKGSEWT